MSGETQERSKRDGIALKHCSNCGGEREHEISVTIINDARRANVKAENEDCAGKPYRVYECLYCERTISERV